MRYSFILSSSFFFVSMIFLLMMMMIQLVHKDDGGPWKKTQLPSALFMPYFYAYYMPYFITNTMVKVSQPKKDGEKRNEGSEWRVSFHYSGGRSSQLILFSLSSFTEEHKREMTPYSYSTFSSYIHTHTYTPKLRHP